MAEQSANRVPDQDRAGAQQRQVGYGYGVNGIPLGEQMPQDAKRSVTPNREDVDFNPNGDLDSNYAEDYFDAEEKRLPGAFEERREVPSEDPNAWSPGLADEQNAEFEALDRDFPDDQALPEMGIIEIIEKPEPEQLNAESSDRYLTEE